MSTELLERRFARIGARVKIFSDGRGEPRIDVRTDGRGASFEVRLAGRGNAIDLEVIDIARADRHLLLLARGGVRQGEWFFVPAPEVDPPVNLVLFDEPLSGEGGKAHVMQFAYRRGHERRGHSSQMVRDPEVFAKGAIRHPDHATVILRGWHRLAMNSDHGARAMRHVAFLD